MGPKKWRKPRHIKEISLLDKETLALFLASLTTPNFYVLTSAQKQTFYPEVK